MPDSEAHEVTALPFPSAIPSPVETVSVQVLSRFQPQELVLTRADGGLQYRVRKGSQGLTISPLSPTPSATYSSPLLVTPSGHWRISFERIEARFEGSLEVRAGKQGLRTILTLPLERYVAQVVASESDPETPPAALQALAVVVRSYAASTQTAPGQKLQDVRHEFSGLCDLSHCQVFRARVSVPNLKRALQAAAQTEGMVLWIPPAQKPPIGQTSWRIARPVFHAACGGQTAQPDEIFQGEDLTGAQSTVDRGCPVKSWQVSTSTATLTTLLSHLVQSDGGARLKRMPKLRLERGIGGYVRWARLPDLHWQVSGETLFRALGQSLGWSQVRSPRFQVRIEGERVWISGNGLGHGVGLCQTGAELRAKNGQNVSGILASYFPVARLAPLSSPPRTP